ncbi:MAG: hypothetical protein QOH17_1664 [Pseudonocardiales bacterium]|nr:hypothetical protein [Pseudonocardiales bacterium]
MQKSMRVVPQILRWVGDHGQVVGRGELTDVVGAGSGTLRPRVVRIAGTAARPSRIPGVDV